MQILHLRSRLEMFLGHRNSCRGFERVPYRNFWRLGPLGELVSGAVMSFLHLRNSKRINSAIVSGQMLMFRTSTSANKVALFPLDPPITLNLGLTFRDGRMGSIIAKRGLQGS